MYYEFIELAPFDAVRDDLFSEEQFLELQWYLCLRPKAGDVIPETGGCRKIRWQAQGKGKRGAYLVKDSRSTSRHSARTHAASLA